MNKSTAGGGAVLAPLKAPQDILHNRIMQKKEEVHDSHNNKVYNIRIYVEE